MKKKLFNHLIKAGRDASGQTIVESLFCSMIIVIILVGLLQIFHLYIAQLLTDYSAFRAARTYCVGFRDDPELDLVGRSARVAAIGASGKLVEPDNMTFDDPMSQFSAEKIMIPEYLSGQKWWMEYEFWYSRKSNKDSYNMKDANEQSIYEVDPQDTQLDSAWNNGGAHVTFSNYPFPFFDLFDPNRIIFNFVVGGKDEEYRQIDIEGSSAITNHASSYLLNGE